MEQQAKPADAKQPPKKIKITKIQNKIIEVASCNSKLSQEDIAAAAGCDRSYVSMVLAKYDIQRLEVEEFKTHRADILAGLQRRLLVSVTDADIKKAPLGSRILAAAQLYDKERLERGQSTDNVAVIGVIRQLQELHRAPVQASQPVDNPVDK